MFKIANVHESCKVRENWVSEKYGVSPVKQYVNDYLFKSAENVMFYFLKQTNPHNVIDIYFDML